MNELRIKESKEIEFWLQKSVYGKKRNEKGKPSKRAYYKYKDIILKKSLSLFHNKNIVDIGCGPMGALHFFPGSLKIGIDSLSFYYQKYFRVTQKQEIEYISAKAEYLPLMDESADYIFCINALDHFEEPYLAVSEMKRILKFGGTLFLQVEINKRHPTPTEPHILSIEKIMKMFEDSFEPGEQRIIPRHKNKWLRKRGFLLDLIGFYPRYQDIFITSFYKKRSLKRNNVYVAEPLEGKKFN